MNSAQEKALWELGVAFSRYRLDCSDYSVASALDEACVKVRDLSVLAEEAPPAPKQGTYYGPTDDYVYDHHYRCDGCGAAMDFKKVRYSVVRAAEEAWAKVHKEAHRYLPREAPPVKEPTAKARWDARCDTCGLLCQRCMQVRSGKFYQERPVEERGLCEECGSPIPCPGFHPAAPAPKQERGVEDALICARNFISWATHKYFEQRGLELVTQIDKATLAYREERAASESLLQSVKANRDAGWNEAHARRERKVLCATLEAENASLRERVEKACAQLSSWIIASAPSTFHPANLALRILRGEGKGEGTEATK